MKQITAAEVKSIKRAGLHRAGDTLYLSVKPSGRKSWIQRVMFSGRRVDIGLGAYPAVTLAAAREKAFENRAMIAGGKDPRSIKRRKRIPTFQEAARKTHEGLKASWTSEPHAKRWMQALDLHAMPKLGDLPVDQITQEDVLKVLVPIWKKVPDTAGRVRQRTRAILKFCQAHGYVEHNVAGEMIDGALPSMRKKRKNFRSLDFQEMPEAFEIIGSRVASIPSRLCLQFLILTASRSKEARDARWNEIDLDSSTWEIPAHKMKQRKPHRVPLSSTAIKVLEKAMILRDESGLIFPSMAKRGFPMTAEMLLKTVRQVGLGEKTVVHGFRSSFRTWAGECTYFHREVCEHALAHVVGNTVEQSYSRGDQFQKRRQLMQEWADFLVRTENGKCDSQAERQSS
ncbi:MAG: DUF4102 domain-containing protein [Gemmatimonadetes bacterium]|nr:DUF4102 domain-containing protein [Gemmatimonadota bacterium]MYB61905.1 DUF4102 domain-containing protein [Gemmatimonadota bacterium]